MSHCKFTISSTLAFLFIAFITFPVATRVAQDSGNSASSQGPLEEIIVTARKREEN